MGRVHKKRLVSFNEQPSKPIAFTFVGRELKQIEGERELSGGAFKSLRLVIIPQHGFHFIF